MFQLLCIHEAKYKAVNVTKAQVIGEKQPKNGGKCLPLSTESKREGMFGHVHWLFIHSVAYSQSYEQGAGERMNKAREFLLRKSSCNIPCCFKRAPRSVNAFLKVDLTYPCIRFSFLRCVIIRYYTSVL